MKRPCRKALTSFLMVAFFGVSAFASPNITVDSADFDVGIIHEGSTKMLKHTFLVKNSGDSVLVIQQVRPS